MNFKNFYILQEELSSKNFKTVWPIEQETFKYVWEYFKKIKNKPNGMIFKNKNNEDFKVQIVNIIYNKEPQFKDNAHVFITHNGWDKAEEIVDVEFVGGGKLHLIKLLDSKANRNYYFMAADNDFESKTHINMYTLLQHLGVKKTNFDQRTAERTAQKQAVKNATQPQPQEKKYFNVDEVQDKYGYFNIDEADYETLVSDFGRIDRKHSKPYEFECEIGHGYKYKVKGDDEEGRIYLFLFNKDIAKKYGPGGKLVFEHPESFDVAKENGMMYNLIGIHTGHKKRGLSQMSQLMWLDKSPQELTEKDFKELAL